MSRRMDSSRAPLLQGPPQAAPVHARAEATGCRAQLLSWSLLAAHFAVLGWLKRWPGLGLAAAAAAALPLAALLLPRPKSDGSGARGQAALRSAECAREWLCNLVAPLWLYVSIRTADEGERLLAGIFMVSGSQVSPWETSLFLALNVVFLAGQHGWSNSLCIPALVFLLTAMNESRATFCREETQTRKAELDGDGAEARRRRTMVQHALRGLPDWTPPTRRELKLFRNTFSLRDELVGVYVCSIQAKVVQQGSLFVSFPASGSRHIVSNSLSAPPDAGAGRLSFRGVTILRTALEFTLASSDVAEVQVCSAGCTATLGLKRPISVKGQQLPVNAITLRVDERGMHALHALFSDFLKHGSGFNSEDDDDGEGTDAEDESDAQSSQPMRPARGASDVEEPFKVVLEAHIPKVELEPLAEELLAQDWTADGTLMGDFYTRMGVSDLHTVEFLDDSKENVEVKLREYTFVSPVPPQPMCPRTTKVTANARVRSSVEGGRRMVTVDLTNVSHDVPFGTNFMVQERTVYLSDDDGRGLSLTKSVRTIWLKSCGWLQGKIMSSIASESAKSGDVLLSLLRGRSERRERKMSGSEIATCTGRVWELQRRTTVFSDTWREPFLPHDRGRRWRWVDETYNKHMWLDVDVRAVAAAASEPPLRAGPGWRPVDRWKVHVISPPDGSVDEEGWQYAVDFYRSSHHWSSSTIGKSVRRRLWTCTYREAMSSGDESSLTLLGGP